MAQSADRSRLRGRLQEFERQRFLVLLQRVVLDESILLGSRPDRHFLIGRGIKRHRDIQRGWSKHESGSTRLIEDGRRLPVRPEQRLDALSHLHIRRTFPIENGGPLDGIRSFDRRPENGLNTFRINGHGIFLGNELTLECVVLDCGCRKNGKDCEGVRGYSKARPGRKSISALTAG